MRGVSYERVPCGRVGLLAVSCWLSGKLNGLRRYLAGPCAHQRGLEPSTLSWSGPLGRISQDREACERAELLAVSYWHLGKLNSLRRFHQLTSVAFGATAGP